MTDKKDGPKIVVEAVFDHSAMLPPKELEVFLESIADLVLTFYGPTAENRPIETRISADNLQLGNTRTKFDLTILLNGLDVERVDQSVIDNGKFTLAKIFCQFGLGVLLRCGLPPKSILIASGRSEIATIAASNRQPRETGSQST